MSERARGASGPFAAAINTGDCTSAAGYKYLPNMVAAFAKLERGAQRCWGRRDMRGASAGALSLPLAALPPCVDHPGLLFVAGLGGSAGVAAGDRTPA